MTRTPGIKVWRWPALKFLGREALNVWRRFPLALLSGWVCAGLAIWAVGPTGGEEMFWSLFLPFTLGLPLYFLAFLFQRKLEDRRFPAPWLAVLGAGLLHVLYLYQAGADVTEGFYYRHFQFIFALDLIAAWAAFTSKNQEGPFWRLNQHLFTRFFMSTVYASVLFLGISVALWSLKTLFDIDLGGAIYARWWFLCVFVFMPWHFMGGMPPSLKHFEKKQSYPAPLRIFSQYLLLPLVLIYGLILYAYMITILWHWTLPRGLVGWMVSGMCLFGMLCLLLLHPLVKAKDQAWIRRFRDVFYLAAPPLLVMVLIAAGLRIRQYGVTENRYALVALALWLGSICLVFNIRKNADIRIIPLSLSILVASTSLGPWSAYSVSIRSQWERLEKILHESGVRKAELWAKAPLEIKRDEKDNIHSILDYLNNRHGVARFWGLDKKEVAALLLDVAPRPMLNFDIEPWAGVEPFVVSGYDSLTQIAEGGWARLPGKEYRGTFIHENQGLRIWRDKEILAEFEVGPLLRRLAEEYSSPGNSKPPPESLRTVVTESAGLKIKLVFTMIQADIGPQGAIKVDRFRAFLLFRKPSSK